MVKNVSHNRKSSQANVRVRFHQPSIMIKKCSIFRTGFFLMLMWLNTILGLNPPLPLRVSLHLKQQHVKFRDGCESLLSRQQLFQRVGDNFKFITGVYAAFSFGVRPVQAAPPIAVIAEELGYFPVQNKDGTVMYIPKRVQRSSTPQAIELAKILHTNGVSMYGAYWCPHCSRQKELFGAEAWSQMSYIECAPKGYGFQGGKACKDVDGYPTFRDKKGKIMNVSGEQPLEFLAKYVGYASFDPSLEDQVPALGTACKQPKQR
jgi:hypothetical protein